MTAAGLRGHAMNAKCIAFLREEKCLVGIAGLKLPRSTYRARVQKSAGFSISEEAFPFELGWVFVLPSMRRRKLSLPLCQPVVAAAGSSGVFATSKSGNFGMHTTLKNLGFKQVGTEWRSRQAKENLMLFVRDAV